MSMQPLREFILEPWSEEFWYRRDWMDPASGAGKLEWA
jgi:hypothetical protein